MLNPFEQLLYFILFIGLSLIHVINQENYITNQEIQIGNQNKILVELSKKYPIYEINLSKQPKQKIKKIKELEKEIQKLLKEE